MSSYILVFIIGLASGTVILYLLNRNKKKQIIKENSVVLIERVKQVLKLVTVEGDFSEIVQYKAVKPKLLSVYNARKKALVTVSAKAMVGFDLAKAKIN